MLLNKHHSHVTYSSEFSLEEKRWCILCKESQKREMSSMNIE
jgi:hypothetical protein